MTDRIAEQGAMQYAIANPDATVSRLGGAGYLQGAIQDAITNGKQSATASRLGAQGRIYAKAAESNLIQNGTFDTDTLWVKAASWSIGSGVATTTGTLADRIIQELGTPIFAFGATYRITGSSTLPSGSFGIVFAQSSVIDAYISASGAFSVDVVAGAAGGTLNNDYFSIRAAGVGFSIDNIRVIRIA